MKALHPLVGVYRKSLFLFKKRPALTLKDKKDKKYVWCCLFCFYPPSHLTSDRV